ncbi:unnamed protein product [Protopolystoma xenopodis]|uniref:Uncharacterized protein n=1 Tax=Protopolystoma xenopodis TaxID=117903 RepID=A0A3S5AIH2_9PLAT|nr:unnamed protein product [Protopolystoma xenopodis]
MSATRSRPLFQTSAEIKATKAIKTIKTIKAAKTIKSMKAIKVIRQPDHPRAECCLEESVCLHFPVEMRVEERESESDNKHDDLVLSVYFQACLPFPSNSFFQLFPFLHFPLCLLFFILLFPTCRLLLAFLPLPPIPLFTILPLVLPPCLLLCCIFRFFSSATLSRRLQTEANQSFLHIPPVLHTLPSTHQFESGTFGSRLSAPPTFASSRVNQAMADEQLSKINTLDSTSKSSAPISFV